MLCNVVYFEVMFVHEYSVQERLDVYDLHLSLCDGRA
jgi:hypothetical protein